jgi:hypothetical protein
MAGEKRDAKAAALTPERIEVRKHFQDEAIFRKTSSVI